MDVTLCKCQTEARRPFQSQCSTSNFQQLALSSICKTLESIPTSSTKSISSLCFKPKKLQQHVFHYRCSERCSVGSLAHLLKLLFAVELFASTQNWHSYSSDPDKSREFVMDDCGQEDLHSSRGTHLRAQYLHQVQLAWLGICRQMFVSFGDGWCLYVGYSRSQLVVCLQCGAPDGDIPAKDRLSTPTRVIRYVTG